MASGSAGCASQCSPIDLTASSSPAPIPRAPTVGSVIDIDGIPDEPKGKRLKKSTSKCWEDFTLSFEWAEVDGKKVKVQWASCNHCGFKRKRNSKNGMSLFLNHLKTHNLMSGQQQLKQEKNATSGSSSIEPYRYDQEASLRKFYLAIIMHEYPFSIVEHEYFVEFIKSLRPSFPMKSRITIRKELMAVFVEEKAKLYEYYMRKFHGKLHYQVKVEEFMVVVNQIYQAYASSYTMSSTTSSSIVGMSAEPNKDNFMEEESDTFESFLYGSHVEGADEGDTCDLDRYVQEQPLRVNKSSQHFDVLSWWKNQQDIYPMLSLVARDVLAMQVSTVASESAFSAGGRVIDPFRSRLEPEMVEALICTKDWVAASRKDSARGVASIVNDLEVVETLVASLTLEDLEERESQISGDDED